MKRSRREGGGPETLFNKKGNRVQKKRGASLKEIGTGTRKSKAKPAGHSDRQDGK